MSKILITGNGFDLFHGLPTKYGHFIAVMKTIEDVNFSAEINFEDLYGRIFKRSFIGDYNFILKNYDVQKIYYDLEKIKETQKLLSVNSWYNHFRKITEIDTWIDFENEIENVLNQISILIDYTEARTVGTNNYFQNRPLNLNVDFSLFKFCENDGNSAFTIYENYINERTKKFDGRKLLNELENSLNEFIIIFNNYLSNIVYEFYNSFKNTLKIPIHYIDFFYTFNYTPTVEKIYNKNTLVTYLHGEINKDISIQNIVLGIDEVPNTVVSKKAFGFSKYYQKVINRTNNYLFQIPEKNTQIIDENIFYIFGHSLDRSDKEHIERIFKFLENDLTDSSNIVVFYLDNYDNKNKLKNLFSFINKDVIVRLNAEQRLNFVEITEENLEKEFKKELWKKEFTF